MFPVNIITQYIAFFKTGIFISTYMSTSILTNIYTLLFSMVQQLLVDMGPLIIEASRSHLYTRHLVVFLWMNDQPLTVSSILQHITFTRERISARWPQTRVLDRAATGVGSYTS
jgi:hypothetical protein